MRHVFRYLSSYNSAHPNHASCRQDFSSGDLLQYLAAVLIILIACCANESQGADGQSQLTPPVLVSSDRVIIPGERVGPIRLTGTIDDIMKLFGPGTARGAGMWGFSKLQTWDAIGLWVVFDDGTGNVFWISVDTSSSNPWAEHSTAEGIRLGAREENVVTAMGAPGRIVRSGGATSLYYDHRGIRFTLADTGPLAGKVGAIRVVWPSVARGDTLVVPGRRISAIEVGMPVDQALVALGGGYHRGESSPGIHVYYWPHLGLSFVERAKRLISVRAGSHIPSDAAALRYATMENLGRDSTASEIRSIFGEPSKADLSNDSSSWIYPSRGIAFALDDRQRVRLIDVFPPENK